MQFVKIYEKKIDVKDDIILDLSKMNIQDILDIKGLETLTNLEYLFLGSNQIKEIKGLDSLHNLKVLILLHNIIRYPRLKVWNPLLNYET